MKNARTLLTACLVAVGLSACDSTSFPTAIPPEPVVKNPGVYTGWVYGPGETPVEVKYVVIDGLSIHEGDINLGPAGSVAKTREELEGRAQLPGGPRFGVVIDGSGHRWGSGRVPYVISSSFNSSQQQAILEGMARISATTAGTQFAARTTESSYVSFSLHSSLCNSEVGRQGGGQTINLTSGCAYDAGTAAHEMLHALGMWHEQSRCDRDGFVAINWANIQSGKEHNFDKKCASSTDLVSYAEASIMHYGRYAFSSNGQPTISSTQGLDHLIGQHNGQLHQADISTMNTIYRPYQVLFTSISYPGGSPTMSWGARNGAASYSVNFVIEYQEWNDYEGTSNVFDYDVLPVGETTALSLVDTQRSYTGRWDCILWEHTWGSARYVYWYEVWANFPDGITTIATRGIADVAPETC